MFMKLKTSGRYLILATAILGQMSTPAYSQGAAQAAGASDKAKPANPEIRIKRQYRRIEFGLKRGKLTEAQAEKLRVMVLNVETDFKAKRDASGNLNEEQEKQIQNALNQNFNQINSALGMGTSTVEGKDTLGPEWKPGADGAQDPKALLKSMKAQQKRMLRQERQQNEQMIEQQELDYEKEVVHNLSNEKEAIQKKKNELENVRQESGAN